LAGVVDPALQDVGRSRGHREKEESEEDDGES